MTDKATPKNAGLYYEAPVLKTDGACVRGTRDNVLAAGRISEPAIDAIQQQAERIVEHVLTCYARDVASGEVGATGSGSASDSPAASGKCPTGLLYGRIQSGKTAAMIATTALAIDNGFRVVVVVTSDILELVNQTLTRFRDLDGPHVCSSLQNAAGEYEWNSNISLIKKHLANRGLVLVVAKNVKHQEALLDFLMRIDAHRYPALILDDEADQATPDTTVKARSKGKPSAPRHGSAIFRKIVHNDAADELGESLRETLKHNVFLQVTATPYALLLQNLDSALRAQGFIVPLEPGEGYVGGETLFADAGDSSAPPVVLVDEHETQSIRQDPTSIPDGLAKAIGFFLVSSAAFYKMRKRPKTGFNFLCHTSPRTVDHVTLSDLIRKCIEELTDEFSRGNHAPPLLEWAHHELLRSEPSAPPLDQLFEFIERRAPTSTFLTVNSSGDRLTYGPHYNFLVGGNILGRGLTIDNLLVTYYLRRAKRTQMDTMLQHARMYGYRHAILPFMRVFVPPTLATRFRQIHETEVALREYVRQGSTSSRVPIQVAESLIATRPSILDSGAIGAYRPGQQVYPVEPAIEADMLGSSYSDIEGALQRLIGGPIVEGDFVPVSLKDLTTILEDFRVLDDDSDWDPVAIRAVLQSIGSRYDQRALLYVREFNPEKHRGVLSSGSISGTEHAEARAKDRPTLFAFRAGRKTVERWQCAPFWHPTVVFPPSMEMFVFNASS